jgi:hypothetical protein
MRSTNTGLRLGWATEALKNANLVVSLVKSTNFDLNIVHIVFNIVLVIEVTFSGDYSCI